MEIKTKEAEIEKEPQKFKDFFNSKNFPEMMERAEIFFVFLENKQEISCMTNMSEFHLRVFKEYLTDKLLEIQEEKNKKRGNCSNGI